MVGQGEQAAEEARGKNRHAILVDRCTCKWYEGRCELLEGGLSHSPAEHSMGLGFYCTSSWRIELESDTHSFI